MKSKLLALTVLIAVTGCAQAKECRCKAPSDTLFTPQECPSKDRSDAMAPAMIPALHYRALLIDDFMAVIGGAADMRVCLSADVNGRIAFRSTRILPWPDVVQAFAEEHGFAYAYGNETIYVYRR